MRAALALGPETPRAKTITGDALSTAGFTVDAATPSPPALLRRSPAGEKL